MKFFGIFLILLIVVSVFGRKKSNSNKKIFLRGQMAQNFHIDSNTIKEGDEIEERFTPQGADINPDFFWDNNLVPEGTKSFAFSVEDPDAPYETFYHWLVINIPRETYRIDRNSVPGDQVTNSWGLSKYRGPSPPKGKTHRYVFRLFALSADIIKVKSPKVFMHAMKRFKLGEASIMGIYRKGGILKNKEEIINDDEEINE